MTNLTDKWKKGELPNGWYYLRLIRGEYRIDLYINGKNEWIDCPDNIIDTVVCEVPSYEEWQAKLEENKRLKHDVGNLGYKIKNQRHEIDNRLKEIEKLKELLKEVLRHELSLKEVTELTRKIDQVLGEE